MNDGILLKAIVAGEDVPLLSLPFIHCVLASSLAFVLALARPGGLSYTSDLDASAIYKDRLRKIALILVPTAPQHATWILSVDCNNT